MSLRPGSATDFLQSCFVSACLMLGLCFVVFGFVLLAPVYVVRKELISNLISQTYIYLAIGISKLELALGTCVYQNDIGGFSSKRKFSEKTDASFKIWAFCASKQWAPKIERADQTKSSAKFVFYDHGGRNWKMFRPLTSQRGIKCICRGGRPREMAT